MNEEQLEQETLAQQSKHTKRSDPTFTSPSSQRHSDLKSRFGQMSSLYIECSLPPCTKSRPSTATKQLELLHMDLMGSSVGESIEKKNIIYVETIRTVCLYLEQLPVRTLINPYGIKRRMVVQIRYRGIHCKVGPAQIFRRPTYLLSPLGLYVLL